MDGLYGGEQGEELKEMWSLAASGHFDKIKNRAIPHNRV